MFEKLLMAYLCFFIVFTLLVGAASGVAMATADEETINQIAQTDITANPYEGTGYNPVAWVTATVRYVTGWATVMTWPIKVYFTGYASYVSIPFTIVGIVIMVGFITRLFGR